MNLSRTSLRGAGAVALACLFATTTAVAGDWRPARVRSVGARPAADSAINLECAPSLGDEPALTVLVVSYRTGKSQAWRAFDVAVDEGFQVGDEVVVSVTACRVARRPRAAGLAAAASAP